MWRIKAIIALRVWLCIIMQVQAVLLAGATWKKTNKPRGQIKKKPLGSRYYNWLTRRHATYLPSPVRQKKRANVRHGRRRGPKLRQRHDVLEGDVRLGADICHGYVLRRARGRGSGRVPPEDLDDDGVPPDGLRHRPLMVDLGEFPRVHLRGGEIHLLRFCHYPRR